MARLGRVVMTAGGFELVTDDSMPRDEIVVKQTGGLTETRYRINLLKTEREVGVKCASCGGIARVGKHRNDPICPVCRGRGWVMAPTTSKSPSTGS